MAARRNSKVIVETVESEVVAPEVTTEAVEVVAPVEVEATVAPVTETETEDEAAKGPLISVSIAPCGYVVRRVNLGTFAVAYKTDRNDRAKVGMVAAVFKDEATAEKAASRINSTGVGINPKDNPAWGAIVLPAYVIRQSELPEVRSQLTWLYAEWLAAEESHRNAELVQAS